MYKKILVTGGAGYVGSHVCVSLCEAGYKPIILDNFSNSSPKVMKRLKQITGEKIDLIKGDVLEPALLAQLFKDNTIDGVFHLAGYKSGSESVLDPLKYYRTNVIGSINILEAMRRANVNIFVFSSSATIYGRPQINPITESCPFSPENPYGQSKRFVEEILSDLSLSTTNFNSASLRYFNPIGAHETGLIGEDPLQIPQNLMPYVSQVAVGGLERLEVFGQDYPTRDGTGVRDYIHVMDVAEAHVAALDYLIAVGGQVSLNIGTGQGVSVLEIIDAFERVSGCQIPWVFGPRRNGDVPECFADSTLAESKLGWRARRDIETMCTDIWRWQQKNPKGYG